MTTLCVEISSNVPCIVMAEAQKREDLEAMARRTGCEIYKEQGEEFYRVICMTARSKQPVKVSL